jgi:methyltransferase-like protein
MSDLVSGRPFRESLLVRDHRTIERTLRAMHMDKLHVVLCGSYRFEQENDAWVLHASQGQYRTSDPIVQAALKTLILRYPASSTLDELSAAAVGSGISESVRAAIRDALFYLVVGGLAIARTEPVCAQPASILECAALEDKLDTTFCCASALARSDAAAGARATANLLHRPVQLTAIDILLLPRLTGDMSIAALLTALTSAVEEGLLTFAEHGDVSLRELLIARLRHYARAALLVAQANDEPRAIGRIPSTARCKR